MAPFDGRSIAAGLSTEAHRISAAGEVATVERGE